MKRSAHPILSYQYIASDGPGLPLVLLISGVVAMALGMTIPLVLPTLYCPLWLFAGLGGLAILSGILTWTVPALRSYTFDLSFLTFLAFFIGALFLAYTNRLRLESLPLLVAVQILFGISFRLLRDYLVFAVASMALYTFCSFYLDGLDTPPGLFLPLMLLVTFMAGVYIWSRTFHWRHLNTSRVMLQNLLDTSHYAIFLLDTACKEIIYQNQIGQQFLKEGTAKDELSAPELLRLLGLEPVYIARRFQMADGDLQEKSFCTLRDQNNVLHDLEVYLNKIQTPHTQHIQLRIRDITDIRTQERSLSLSQSVNNSLTHALPDLLITLDQAGIIQTVQGMQKAAGLFRQKDILGHPLTEVLSGQAATEIDQWMETARAQEQVLQRDLVTGPKDAPHHYELRLVRLGDGPDLMAIIREVTEARKSSAALLQSEQNYREIFNSGTDGILILEPHTLRPLDANQVLCQMLGYEREALLNRPVDALCPDDLSPQLIQFLKRTLEGEENLWECPLRQQDGQTLPTELSARLTLLGGEFRLMLLARDITERVAQAEALRSSEQRYRTLVERMNEGLVLTDAEERILFVNDRVTEILGIERSDLINRVSYEILKGKDVVEVIRSKSLLRKQGISDQYELSLTRPDGQALWVLVTGSPYEDKAGQFAGSLAILTDITARKEAELQLMEKNRELDAFVYKASHDLRGPLASIAGVTNLASEEVKDPKALRFFQMISKTINRLDLTLTDLMEVTRTTKTPVNLQP
ncbi:MAG: PAS domain S-box protein, partial [Bacteroidetes bacterium]